MAQPTCNFAITSAHRQCEGRADFGGRCDGGELRGQTVGVARRPNHHAALGLQVIQIDPWRTARLAVDQSSRLVRRIIGDVATVLY
jgi:hypothetical protein